MSRLVGCLDVGSTYTKLAVVDVDDGTLVATASHPTTVDTDVLRGVDAVVAAAGVPVAELRACSSAGGGLRLAVVGYEELVTAEAGHRVGMSAGAKVVHVAAGPLTGAGVVALRAARPDVVLLVGGTDGGDADVIVHNARRLAAARLRIPVVVAGNADARDPVTAALTGRGVPTVATGNVLPRIGELRPAPARAAIREVFLRHVIGGKKLSRGPRFPAMVRGATPDVVLSAVERLAGDVVVVDVGGATTDVYSVLVPDPERERGPRREVAGTLWHARTVEGDLGVRWNAPGILAAARAERLIDPAEADRLAPDAAARAADPGLLAADPAVDARLAALAVTVALRRHARGERRRPTDPYTGGKDLRHVRLVVGSGGVLRALPGPAADRLLGAALGDHAGGFPLPRDPRRAVDRRYVLAAAGLLGDDHPAAADRLLTDAGIG